jgi:hypothetical protein
MRAGLINLFHDVCLGSFASGSGRPPLQMSVTPRERRSATKMRSVANGMDRPRSRPQRLSECAGALSGEGARPCLARPRFTQ